MTTKQLLAFRKKLKKEIALFTKNKNKEWGPALKAWEKANITLLRNKVYELVENGIKRRGFKRFLMVTFQGQFIKGDHLIYQCAGWWLDENNTPAKWDNMTIYGVGNKAVFKLSANQKHNKAPQNLLDRQ